MEELVYDSESPVDWLFLMLNNPNRDQEFAKKLYDKAKEMEKKQCFKIRDRYYGFGFDDGANYIMRNI